MIFGGHRFGVYLKQLIKSANMMHTEFYTALCIKKLYFYDIMSGRITHHHLTYNSRLSRFYILTNKHYIDSFRQYFVVIDELNGESIV